MTTKIDLRDAVVERAKEALREWDVDSESDKFIEAVSNLRDALAALDAGKALKAERDALVTEFDALRKDREALLHAMSEVGRTLDPNKRWDWATGFRVGDMQMAQWLQETANECSTSRVAK